MSLERGSTIQSSLLQPPLIHLNRDVVLELVSGVDEEGEEGEVDVVVRRVDTKGHLWPDYGDGEEDQAHGNGTVHPTPQPHLPMPFYRNEVNWGSSIRDLETVTENRNLIDEPLHLPLSIFSNMPNFSHTYCHIKNERKVGRLYVAYLPR